MSRTQRKVLEKVEKGTGTWKRDEVKRTDGETTASKHERKIAVTCDRRWGLVRIARHWDYEEGDYHRLLRRCGRTRCEHGAMEWETMRSTNALNAEESSNNYDRETVGSENTKHLE